MSGYLPLRHLWRDAVTDCTDDRVDAYTVAVMNALHRHMDPDGVAYVGLRRLAEVARCTVNTVRARLDVLAELGWLAVDRDGQARTIYRAQLPGATPVDVVEAVESGAVDNPTGVPAGVSPERQGVSSHGANCVTGRHTYTSNPLNPARRSPSRGFHDPSLRRPAPDRPPPEPSHLEVRDDGTLWVSL